LDYATTTPVQSGTPNAVPGQARLTRMTNVFMAAYLVAVLILMLGLSVQPTPDVVIVVLAIAALFMGRGLSFLRDWVPFLMLFLAWEMMRGIANEFGTAVHSDDVIAVERAIFGGRVPAEVLQAAFYQAGQVHWYDVTFTLAYASHFFFPIALAFILWMGRRERYYPYVAALMLTSFAAFATFLVFPVAPPRYAFQYGDALAVVDVAKETGTQLAWNGFNFAYNNLVGNPVAAFPSLHAAYPVLIALFLAERWPKAALAWLPMAAVIYLATIYLGHHYVIDLMAGAAYALVAYLLVRMLWPRQAQDTVELVAVKDGSGSAGSEMAEPV
jgi:membrane-associated phospholipid phosphatase